MTCTTCGKECGADGIVSECRNNPNVSNVDYAKEIREIEEAAALNKGSEEGT